jgi:hypothetical protein
MSEPLYLLSISLVFGTTLVIFGMKYFSAAHQARSRAMGEEAYRDLAAKAVAAQSEAATSLAAVKGELSDIKSRMAAVEKILKAVE